MENILENMSSDGELSVELYEQIQRNVEDAKFQIDREMSKIIDKELEGVNKDIGLLCELYNNFSEETDFTKYLLCQLYDFYRAYIDVLISKEYYFTIYLLIDLFSNNNVFKYYDIDKNNTFVEKTLPILLIHDDDMSSFISIASLRFIGLLNTKRFDNSREYLKKYLSCKPNISDVYIKEIEKSMEDK